jgi:hypothetical protein
MGRESLPERAQRGPLSGSNRPADELEQSVSTRGECSWDGGKLALSCMLWEPHKKASSEESVGPLSTRIAAGSPARAAAGRRTAQRQLFLFVAGWLSNQLAFLVNATPSIEGNHNRRWATFRNRPSAGASVNSHEPVRI